MGDLPRMDADQSDFGDPRPSAVDFARSASCPGCRHLRHPPPLLPRLRRGRRQDRPGLAARREPGAEAAAVADPLAPRPPHFAPKAKRVIYLFMAGAPSQLDLFDDKPTLKAVRRQARPGRGRQGAALRLHPPRRQPDGLAVRVRPARDQRRRAVRDAAAPGEGGGRHRDRQVGAHRPVQPRPGADLRQHRLVPARAGRASARGSPTAWAARRATCPASSSCPPAAASAAARPTGPAGSCRPPIRGSPSARRATRSSTSSSPAGVRRPPPARLARPDPRPQRAPPRRGRRPRDRHPDRLVRDGLSHAVQRPGADGPLRRDGQETMELYGAEPGKASFANNCLLARRLVERGVRFVNLYHEGWDHHSDVAGGLKAQCGQTDRAAAALVIGPQAARPARRHPGRLGRRVRPHADGRVQRHPRPVDGPRPPPAGVHHVVRRRRDQARHHPRRAPTTSASTSSRTPSTSTTSRRRSSTSWASTTPA